MKVVKPVAIVVLSLVVSVLGAECVCRAFPGARSAAYFKVTPWLNSDFYRLAAHVGYEIVPSVSREVNSLGMRGPERPASKPKDGFRVLVLGDSVAYGVGVDTSNTFAARLETLLHEGARDRYVDVLNAAVVGYDTQQELAVLEQRLALDPDVVVLAYCPNDCDPTPFLFKQGNSFCYFRSGFEPRTYPSFWIEHSALFRRFVVASEASFLGASQVDSNRKKNLDALGKMARRLRDRGTPLLVVIFPYLQDSMKNRAPQYVRIHDDVKFLVGRNLSGDQGGVIDLLDVWRNRDVQSLRNRNNPSDFVHPNEDGHREAADSMARWLQEHVLRGS